MYAQFFFSHYKSKYVLLKEIYCSGKNLLEGLKSLYFYISKEFFFLSYIEYIYSYWEMYNFHKISGV